MDFQIIRQESLKEAEKLGYETNPALPLLDDSISLRIKDEIIFRSLSLFSAVACSYGFNKKSASAWISSEKIESYLSGSEKAFITGDEGDDAFFRKQVEGLNAFAWVLGFVKTLDFGCVCDNTLIKKFPDIKNTKPSTEFKLKASVRSLDEIVSACDLAYCLHWAISDAAIEGREPQKAVGSNVIVERRRALEWVLSTDDWDDISLNT